MMNPDTVQGEKAPRLEETAPPAGPRRFKRSRTSLFAVGEPMIWLTGGALVVCAVMIVGLMLLILSLGLKTFWPSELVRFTTLDDRVYMGEVTRSERFRIDESLLVAIPAAAVDRARSEMMEQEGQVNRRLVRTGNFKLTQNHFQWVDDFMVKETARPEWALVVERMEWGIFYGFPRAFARVASFIAPQDNQGNFKSLDRKKEEARQLASRLAPRDHGIFQVLGMSWQDGEEQESLYPLEDMDSAQDILGVAEVAEGAEAAWALYLKYHDDVRKRWRLRRGLEKDDAGRVNAQQEEARIELREAELDLEDAESDYGKDSHDYAVAKVALRTAREQFEKVKFQANKAFDRIRLQINEINAQNSRFLMAMETAGEGTRPPQSMLLPLDEIVRAYPANRLSFGEKTGVYLSRWWEFITDEPREANSEGGVFPAIFGTVMMTLMMALAVVPFGVLAALYLREYAKAGPIVSAVRIAVNNLAGVPSIVFGVFGLGFFCYGVGGFIDGGPAWQMPKGSWFVLLGATTVVGALAFLTLLWSMTRPGKREPGYQKAIRYVSLTLWAGCALLVVTLVATTPFFDGWYRAQLPNPTFGKGALIWASFTLALMTLPVVIVATEEALSAVPNSMREGSYACGASKWQTIRRIVLPRALPGIMTGLILAMARGAGEVAPLMLVGAVKMAPKLPLDMTPPFGLNRSFMHLGFHIYDVGFQSQNSEAAKPMVYTTTLLLILIIASLNVAAIWLRSRLRRRFVANQF